MSYLKNNYRVLEERLKLGHIPLIRLYPENYKGPMPSLIFYHGLGSNKERQRIRAYIIASFGYQVLIPDALHHGERDPKESQDQRLIYSYFYQAIIQSIKELDQLLDLIIDRLDGDRDNIYLSGHSMGGYISAGGLAKSSRLKGAIPMNGSLNWKASNRLMKKNFEFSPDLMLEEDYLLEEFDPSENIEGLRGKELLILSGQLDPEVDIRPQREFFKKYGQELRIQMQEQEGVGHFVTTGMMESLIEWLGERVYGRDD